METESLVKSGNFWFPEGIGEFAKGVDWMFNFIYMGSIVLFIAIVAVMFYFLTKYKRSDSNQVAKSQLTHNNVLEITWTVIPFFLVLFIFYWGYKDFLKYAVPPADTMEIRLTGKMWLWQVDYPQEGITTIGEIVVPVDQAVKLVMSSEDVIHSFYAPNFRVKRDVVPNRYSTVWFKSDRKGVFQVFCTEFCGDGHSNMGAVIKVVSRDEYEEWLVAGSSTDDVPLLELGERIYTKNACNTCHSLDGSRMVGPTWKDLYGANRPLADGSNVKADDNYLRESIVNPGAKIVAGYPPVMPSYAGLLSDREIDALIEFIKSVSEGAK